MFNMFFHMRETEEEEEEHGGGSKKSKRQYTRWLLLTGDGDQVESKPAG